MTSAVLHKINDLRLDDSKPIPTEQQLGDYDVLISPQSVGICGSDVHYVTHGEIGPFVVKAPMTLGHECSGRVEAVGKQVTTLKVGDRVAVEVGIPCRRCEHCRTGNYNLCADIAFAATPPYDGILTQRAIYPADFCYKIPDNMSYDEAAFVEPMSVAVHAVKKANIKIGQNVLVTGAGPIGLVNVLIALAAGATSVVVTDINNDRLQVAKKVGATHVVNTMKEDLASVLKQHSILIDAAIECSGNEKAVNQAMLNTKSGGVVVIVGHGPHEMKLPVADAFIREIDLRGVFRYKDTYPTAINLISTGKVNVKPLITHHFDFKDTLKAFEVARVGKSEDGQFAIKVMIHVGNAGQQHGQQERKEA